MNEYFSSPPSLPPESPPDRPHRHWFYRFFFDTWWGPVVVWWTVALLNMILWVVSPFLGKFGTILETCCGGLLTITTLAVIIAWIKTLVARKGARAAGQFALGCLSMPVAAVLGSVALAIATPIAAQKTPGRNASHFTVLDRGVGPQLFQIEFTLHHYIPTEYDKAIVFPSGKRIGLFPDTGGNAPFAVYRLPTGEYYLVDSLRNLSYKNEYRVNAEAETVEMRSDDLWITIPDGTRMVTGGGGGSIIVQMEEGPEAVHKTSGNGSIIAKTDTGEKEVRDGVPIGDSLRDREFRGIVHPGCSLESPSQVADPLAEVP